MKARVVLSGIILLTAAAPGTAATRLVPDGYATIQEGIDACAEGDVVIVAPGRYVENINFGGRGIILRSKDPSDADVVSDTIVDGGRSGSVVTFDSGEGSSCVLDGFTITGGQGEYGGGIYCADSSPTITNCVIVDNTTNRWTEGGGIYCTGSSPTIEDCTISDNWPTGNGGGVCCYWDSNPSIINCRIANNRITGSQRGGGIFCSRSAPTVVGCVISGNTYCGITGGEPTVRDCVIRNNGGGGGVMSAGGLITGCTIEGNTDHGLWECSGAIVNCVISNNQGYEDGAGVARCTGPIDNCLIIGNMAATASGGGIDITASSSAITNCIITGNWASRRGGGIYGWFGSNATVRNCIVWNNRLADEREMNEIVLVYDPGRPCTLTVSYSDVEGGLAGTRVEEGSELIWGPGNIEADPLFVDPAWGDYHLPVYSPCTDAGDPDFVAEPGATDIEGEPRVVNGRVDIGAYEFQGPVHVLVDDDAPGDPGPGDPNVSDPEEDGTALHPFDSVQEAVDAASEGQVVMIHRGVYRGEVDFMGKAITVTSATDAAVLENPDDFAVLFWRGEGAGSVLKNVVVRDSFAGIFAAGSSPTIRNVTVVGNNHSVVALEAEPDVSNSILQGGFWWGCPVRYSCVGEGVAGEGNIGGDPMFVDPANGDYHLLSERGRYRATTDEWLLDRVSSPCIDAGDPASDYSREPEPNGGRINMGAYGGTAYASMSETWPPGDLNDDRVVDMLDFAIMAAYWLEDG
ncbi:MAG: right-handed parallel beta-helix repeat-containing protein, partial [Phycisphaerales bacterium]